MDREALAGFLRDRRARVQPGDVGLEPGRRRRTPGLRREEVAALAGMSVDYYTRLEQARGPHPSASVLGALARALRLSDDERRYLFDVAGPAGASPGGAVDGGDGGTGGEVPMGILHLLDRLDDAPAYVVDAGGWILAWNRMTSLLWTDFSNIPAAERNMIRWTFLDARDSDIVDDGQQARHEREAVADLRAAVARHPGDPRLAALVAELQANSRRFAELWERHEVAVRRRTRKEMIHPVVGPLELDLEILLLPDRDQRLIIMTAAPGSPSADALRLLRVVGHQDLAPH